MNENADNKGRDEARQIKEGAIRPLDNPSSLPPTTIEVTPPGADKPAPGGEASDSANAEG